MISGFSFDGRQIGKLRFAKIRSVDCYREASLGIQLRPCRAPPPWRMPTGPLKLRKTALEIGYCQHY